MADRNSASFELRSLLDLDIETISAALQADKITSEELVKAYLERIEEAKEFNAVLQLNPEAMDLAKKLDTERRDYGRRSALHGIPVLVKDNIATVDKLDVSAGSYALLGAKPRVESSLISRLRSAGAIILGKTNLSEWANFRGLNVSNGWSPRGGQTMGSYYPNSTPVGSSSGSAVAVALGLSSAALGTETWGSILGPAEFNGVVGFKPSRGLIATDGAIPISKRQDVVGPLTRTVKDAAFMVNIMAGRSEGDERTWNIPFNPIPDFTTFCKSGPDSLKGITIGVPRNTWEGKSPAPIEVSFDAALKTLSSAGANIVDPADFPDIKGFKKLNNEVKGIVRSSEFKRDIVSYIRTLDSNPNDIQSVEDLIEFTKTDPREEFPDRDVGKFQWTQAEGVDVGSEKYKKMIEQEQYFGGPGGILGAMKKYNLDVIAFPHAQDISNDLAAKMGFPAISVPLGFWPEDTPMQYTKTKPSLVKVAPGMPYSIAFVTKAFSDGVLLQVAHTFETLSAVRDKGPRPFRLPRTELRDVRQRAERI